MTEFAHFLDEDRRLVILKALAAADQFRLNQHLLQSFCASLGHSVSGDKVRTDLAWLTEQGLIKTEQVLDVTIATLTRRGADVADGRARAPGVKRPLPGE